MIKRLFIFALLGIIPFCCGCGSIPNPEELPNYPTIIRDEKSDEYGYFGVNDILLGVKGENWSNWGYGQKGLTINQNSAIGVDLDKEGRVIHIEAQIHNELLNKYPVYIDGEKIDSVDKYLDLVCDNKITSSKDVSYMDGKVISNTHIRAKVAKRKDDTDVLICEFSWTPEYTKAEPNPNAEPIE